MRLELSTTLPDARAEVIVQRRNLDRAVRRFHLIKHPLARAVNFFNSNMLNSFTATTALEEQAVRFSDAAQIQNFLEDEPRLLEEAEGLTLKVNEGKEVPHTFDVGYKEGRELNGEIKGEVNSHVLILIAKRVFTFSNGNENNGKQATSASSQFEGSIDGKTLSPVDALTLWNRYYCVLRRQQLREKQEVEKKERDEAANARERDQEARKIAEAKYRDEVGSLIADMLNEKKV